MLDASVAVAKIEALPEPPSLETVEGIVKPLTMLDALRAGASVTDQAIGTFGDGIVRACGLSAIEIGLQYYKKK